MIAASSRHGCRSPFANAVHGEDHSFLKGRGEKRAGRVAQVVFGEEQASFGPETAIDLRECIGQELSLEELLTHPKGDGHGERTDTARSECDVGLDQSLEFQEGLIVEYDKVEIFELHALFREAIPDCFEGKARVVFLSCKSFFLRRGDDLAVTQQCGGTIVVERGNPQNTHGQTL
jgi:hypothetical protein